MDDIWISDIFGIIVDHLSQLDLINFSRADKRFNRLVIPFIYHSVTFDSNYSQFEEEFKKFNTTFIRSKPNLIRFITQCVKSPQKYGSLVHEFNILNIQPEFHDFEVFLLNVGNTPNQSLFQVMDLVSLNLKVPLGFNLLAQVLNDANSRNKLSKLSYTMERYNSNRYGQLPSKTFPNLLELQIENIYDLNQYNTLINLIDDDSGIQDISLHFKPENEIPHISAGSILRSLYRFVPLRRLSLSSLDFNLNDIRLPSSFGSNFTFLELNDISISNQGTFDSILDMIFQNQEDIKLESLKLNLVHPGDDSIPNFLYQRLLPHKLKEMDLTIRHNRRSSIPLEKCIDAYIGAILNHSQSLTKLSVEIRDSSNNNMIDELNVEHITKLITTTQWPNLKSLTLQTSFHLINTVKLNLFTSMIKLENLWILGPNSIPKHFGSGNAYPGIFDKWWRIIHLPKWFIEGKPFTHPLKYIKIDDCLFIIDLTQKEIVSPKDSGDELFYRKTKITF